MLLVGQPTPALEPLLHKPLGLESDTRRLHVYTDFPLPPRDLPGWTDCRQGQPTQH